MELEGRDLARNMTGKDVASLHSELIRLGYQIASQELDQKLFGESTSVAVVDFQTKFKLKPTGIVNAKTAWIMDPTTKDHPDHPNKFIVHGHIRQANGAPFHGAVVKAFDKDLRSQQQLGKTDTAKKDGDYEIFYRVDEFNRAEKDHADLLVRVFNASGTELTSSSLIFNAQQVENVDIAVMGEGRGISEYDNLVSVLTPLLDGVPIPELTADDIAFLTGETRITANFINLLVESARRRLEANTIPQSVFYGLFRQNLPTVLEELLQQEMPLLRSALELSANQGIISQLTAAELDQIIEQLQILKASLLLQPAEEGQTSSLGDLLKTAELTTDKQRIVAEMLVEHGGTTEAFWQALDQRSDFTQTEKNDVRFTLDVGDLTTNHLPLVLELRSIAGLFAAPKRATSTNPKPQVTLTNGDATALRPFARFDVADWKEILQQPQSDNEPPIGAPPTIPGANLQEKIDNYSIALNQHMERVLPTPVIAGRLEKDVSDDSPFKPVRADLRTFFSNNAFYEFRKTPIDVYLGEGRDEKLENVTDPVALIAELKNMQRIFNIAPRYEEIRSLRADDLHSAMSMVKVGQRKFIEKYAASLGGADKAGEAYRKAEQVNATALMLYLKHSLASNSSPPFVIPSGAMVPLAARAASAGPDLPTLFGSLDLCDCEHCQSLYSPAAYFVDVLEFLSNGPLKDNLSPLQVLLERRPDLEHIELTCENTSTQLPYVDLAREILEADVAQRIFAIAEGSDINSVISDLDAGKVPANFPEVFVSNGYSLTDKASVRIDSTFEGQTQSWLVLETGWAFLLEYLGPGNGFTVGAWPQTSWTSDELRANPEHVNDAAYAVLRQALYPWNLPLNLPVEEIRIYLRHLGLRRYDVMQTFFRSTPVDLEDETIANEQLGLTKEEAEIITGVKTGDGPWDFWGLKQTGNEIEDLTDGTAPPAEGDWDVVLKRVSIFLQQSGLSYRELLELLSSFFINPAVTNGRTLGIASTDPADTATCNLSKLEIQVTDSQIPDTGKKDVLIAAWNRIHRFVRLWRKLGWAMRDLDKAIVALKPTDSTGEPDLTADFLVWLSHIQGLRSQLDLPVVNLLSFWAAIDTERYLDHLAEGQPNVPSLYAQLFNNKSATGQSLAEDPAALSGKLSENTSTISAALQITIDDLNLLLADSNVIPPDPIEADKLTLASLSHLYRHATFARALKYTISTYLSTLKLINSTPFATTTDTVSFAQHSAKILASGFSIEDLNYLLRHDFAATSPIAIGDEAIAVVLNSLREEVRKVSAENNFVEASSDATSATNDPNGDLTRRKLALLNWDTALIEQLIAILNGAFTGETGLDNLAPGTVIPESLRGRLTYDSVAKQLRFTGVMTEAEKTLVNDQNAGNQPFRDAVNVLFDAPRRIVSRHMSRFSIPRFAESLDPLPTNIIFSGTLNSKIYYDNAEKKLKFIGVMTEAERKLLLALSTDSAYRTVIEKLFEAPDENPPAATDLFLTSSDVATLFDDADTAPPSRFLLVLEKLLPYLRATLSERIVIQRVGEFLRLDSKAAHELLTTWVNSPAHPDQKAVTEFLKPEFTESSLNVESTKTEFPDQFKTFLLLYKIATLGLKFNVTSQQLEWLFEFGPDNGWLDLNQLPLDSIVTAHLSYSRWARLADLFQLRDALPLGEVLLTDIFTSARDSDTQLDALLDKLSKGLAWNLDNLTALSGPNGFNLSVSSFQDEVALRRLHDTFELLEQLGASADQCLSWTKSGLTEIDERKCAQDIKRLVRARSDGAQWPEIAKALNDPLREKQRSALVSYLTLKKGARNADELYDDFLIDVEMSPCMMTTRLKQAISSVQLFIQRCLMNLESDVALTPSDAREWTQWRKQYRIWEANRKILLYPENWIEPELRDGKSSFYQDLENELLQSDVTMETAETAFLHYLEKLHEVARLEIVGMYWQKEPSTGLEPAIDILHVLGRTFAAPYIYYYRRQVDSAYWTPWERVEADIHGSHLIPVIWNRRLYLFWPVFSIKQKEKPIKMPPTGTEIESGKRSLEIQLAWTEYKSGKWSAKKLASPFLSPLKHPDLTLNEADFMLFSFKSRIQTTPENEQQLFLDCYGPVEFVNPAPATSTQEKFLFTLIAEGTKSVFATVNGNPFQPSDVNKVEIVARNSQTGNLISRSRLSENGTAEIENTAAFSVKYYLASADYQAENIVVTRSRQFCWEIPAGGSLPIAPPTGPNVARRALSGNGDTATRAMIGGGTPREVCEIITEAVCEFDLVPLQTSSPAPTTSVASMHGIMSFLFDDGQQSVAPVSSSNAISSLEPIVGTRFENMMMVEYQNSHDGLGESKILKKTPGTFRLLPMSQSYLPKAVLPPFFFQDDLHTYFLSAGPNSKVRFDAFYHPTVRSFVRSLNRHGIKGLLTLANQRLTDKLTATGPPTAFNTYEPDLERVDVGENFTLAPREDVDFRYEGAYSIYNWELFFHAPFQIAVKLSQNQRFEEAQKWFHYIFDPTATDSPDKPSNPGPERFWRVRPLYNEALRGVQTLEQLFANADKLNKQVNEWKASPFKPHVIARLRLVTYMRAVVMRYVDNLIAWADQLFRRDTIESNNEATQLYILAAQILGWRPERIPARAKAKIQTFRSLDDEAALNSLANAAVEIESFLSPSVAPDSNTETGGGVPSMLFFGIPGNEKLLGYWDTVADRLFKIRHCLNIEGASRSLPLFEPPIEPGLLVKAATAGVDITSALNEINVALPHYRFGIMLQKATDLCNEVKALGGALFAALEKRDAEALALMRSTHEMQLLKAVRTIKEKQVEEAKETRDALERSKELTTLRRNYYRDIAFMNPWEIGNLFLTGTSLILQDAGIRAHILAGIMHLLPNTKIGTPTTVGFTHGGENVGEAAKEFGESISNAVSLLNTTASMTATMGSYQRRADDWKLQREVADKELEQIERQIAAAKIRVAIAEKDLSNHDIQIENSNEVDEFMRNKFTNRELYDWMVGQIAGIYFQSYQLAYDVAKRAERAYRYELGLRDSSVIQFGYWDSLKKGLLAGERLAHDLRRMDVAYLDQNKREYEIAKHISILAIDPISLIKLKETGECFVSLPEALFDVDCPGHYMRRIKAVGLTIPCVAGPYTSINCTLTLHSSSIRHDSTLAGGKYARQAEDPRFSDSAGMIQSIVTSGAQNDSGLFETNLRDERYLPFEGQGAISSWRIELPKNFKTFDYATISDVVLHLRYTAREGGAVLKGQAVLELQTALNEFISIEGKRGLAQMFSLRHEFSTEWSRFLNPAAGADQSLTMALTRERFPFLFQSREITINAIELFVKVRPGFLDHNQSTVKITLAAGETAPTSETAQPGDILPLELWNGLLHASRNFSSPPGAFTLNAWRNTDESLEPNAIQDILVVCRYTCS